MRSVLTRILIALGAIGLATTLGVACSSTNPPGLGEDGALDGGGGTGCSTPAEGCPCSSSGDQIACGDVVTRSGDYVTCSMGTRSCSAGTWGDCIGSRTVFQSVAPLLNGGIGTQDYGTPTACTGNPCDPACTNFPDNSNGVDAGTLLPVDGGWTLPGHVATGNCPDAGLQCQELLTCAPGQGPTITGVVYDPAAQNPIYNALVMIPNGAVPAFPPGVSSAQCGGTSLPQAVSYAYSDFHGKFTLSAIPIGTSIPLLIQIGRWRRQVTINTSSLTCGGTLNISTGCSGVNNYAGTAGCLTRLPRTESEGNIPEIAIATGGLDPEECLLYRMGVASSQFTDENGGGRVNVFVNSANGSGGSTLASPNANHDLSYLLGFTCPFGVCPQITPTGCTSTAITNPGFETGNLNGWTKTGSYAVATNAASHSGSYSAYLGSASANNSGTNTLSQTFTAPAASSELSFWYAFACPSGNTNRGASATLVDNTAGTTNNVVPDQCSSADVWTEAFAPLTPGHGYTLTFTSRDSSTSHASYALFDDISTCTGITGATDLTSNYDLIMLPCNGGDEYDSGSWDANSGDYNDDVGRAHLVNYANIGGRVFTSHWGREWVERTSATFPSGPFANVANWFSDGNPAYGGGANDTTGFFDTASTRSANFATWMGVTTASSTSMTIVNARYDATATVTANSVRFVYAWSNNSPSSHPGVPDTAQDFTFDTPVGSTSPLGRVMYTDMHLASGTPSGTFPGNCPAQGSALTSQELAAEYLLFDLGSCVGSNAPPPMMGMAYSGGTVSRVYDPVCPAMQEPIWRFFYWEDSIPAVTSPVTPSNIVFSVQTSATSAGLSSATIIPLATVNTTNLTFTGSDVGAALTGAGLPSTDAYLQVNMTLDPSSDMLTAPDLLAWQLTYDCVDSE
jgi:hypothetical protein